MVKVVESERSTIRYLCAILTRISTRTSRCLTHRQQRRPKRRRQHQRSQPIIPNTLRWSRLPSPPWRNELDLLDRRLSSTFLRSHGGPNSIISHFSKSILTGFWKKNSTFFVFQLFTSGSSQPQFRQFFMRVSMEKNEKSEKTKETFWHFLISKFLIFLHELVLLTNFVSSKNFLRLWPPCSRQKCKKVLKNRF